MSENVSSDVGLSVCPSAAEAAEAVIARLHVSSIGEMETGCITVLYFT